MTCAETRPVDFETGWQVVIGKEQEWIEADENSPAWLCLIHPREARRQQAGLDRKRWYSDLLWGMLGINTQETVS